MGPSFLHLQPGRYLNLYLKGNFNMKLSKKDLRLLVVQDVLDSLRSMVVAEGSFVSTKMTNTAEKQVAAAMNLDDSKATAQRLKKHCEVCALGACLLSTVALDNAFIFTGSNVNTDTDQDVD